jgi:hypothetical protein
MKNQNLQKLHVIMAIIILSTPAYLAFAGSKNQNGDHGTQGTEIVNGLDGCAPGLQAGNRWVYVPSDTLDVFLAIIGVPQPWNIFHEWEGGPCCPSNTLSGIGSDYPLPNQCCNGPDYLPEDLGGFPTGEHAPGNHCVCFEIRGYPFILIPLP